MGVGYSLGCTALRTTFCSEDRCSAIEPLKHIITTDLSIIKNIPIKIANHERCDLTWYNYNIMRCLFSWNLFLGIISKVFPEKRSGTPAQNMLPDCEKAYAYVYIAID